MLNQKLQLKLSQKLSPQQIQLMKLIQLSTQEFEQSLSREIEEESLGAAQEEPFNPRSGVRPGPYRRILRGVYA